MRTEVLCAKEDFEDIVEEIDGGLSHLQWRNTVMPIPHFTDTVCNYDCYKNLIQPAF